MKSINIQDALEFAPFRPFTIELDNGKKIKVHHPDFVMLSPSKNTAVIFVGEHIELADVDHISNITLHKRQGQN